MLRIAEPQAQGHPPLTEQVEYGRLLGHQADRPQWQQQDVGAEPQPPGARGDGPKDRKRRRQVGIVEPVMFAGPDAVKAEPIGQDDFLH